MSMRQKAMLVIVACAAAAALVSILASRTIFLDSYRYLEEDQIRNDLARARNALDVQVASLRTTVADWAVWDDTYAFVADGNEAYREDNFQPATLQNLGLDAMLFISPDGRLVARGFINGEEEAGTSPPVDLLGRFGPGSPLAVFADPPKAKGGVLVTAAGPLLFAAHPIMPTNYAGPSRGLLVIVRSIGPELVAGMTETTRLRLTLETFDSPALGVDLRGRLAALQGRDDLVERVDPQTAAGWTTIPDAAGDPALVLGVTTARSIWQRGVKAAKVFALGILAVGLAVGLVGVLALDRLALKRLSRMGQQVAAVRRKADPSGRITLEGNDELTALGGELNAMLASLQESQEGLERMIGERTASLEAAKASLEVEVEERRAVEKELRSSEARYSDLFEGSHAMMMVIDPESLRIVDVNPAAAAFYGWSRDELKAMRISDINVLPHEEVSRAAVSAVRGEVNRFEFRHRLAGGELRDVEVNTGPVKSAGRTVLFSVIHDVTERLRTEEALRLDEARLEALLRMTQMSDRSERELTYFALEEGVKLTSSAVGYLAFVEEDGETLTMYAWSRDAVAGCSVSDPPTTYHLNDTGLWGEAVRQRRPMITNDYSAPSPWKRGLPDGHVPLTRHLNIPILDGDRVVVVAGVGNKAGPYDESDVRQLTLLMDSLWQVIRRRRFDAELSDRRARLESVLRTAPVGIGIVVDRVFTEVNDAVCSVTGYSREELMGRGARMLYPNQEEYERVGQVKYGQIAARGFGSMETIWQRKDGSIMNVILASSPIVPGDNSRGVTFTALDITERKRAEEAVRESEEQFRSLAENLPAMVFINEGGRVVYANRRSEEVLGWSREELLSPSFDFMILVDEGSRQKVLRAFEAHAEGREVEPYEYRLVTRGGERLDGIIATRLVSFRGRRAILGIVTDITERHRFEEALRESEEAYRQLFEAESDALFLIDNETGSLLRANEAASALYGYSKEELLNLRNVDLSAEPEDTKRVTTTTPPDREQVVVILDRLHRKKNGTVFPVEITGRFFARQGRSVHIAAIRDITERKRAEEALLRAKDELERQNEELRKLDHIKDGLVRDVSHELKTPVAKQAMQLEMLKDFLRGHGLEEDAARLVAVLESSIRRQESAIRNILDLARLEGGVRPYRREPVRLDDLARQVLDDYHHAFETHGVAVDTDLEPVSVLSDGEMLWHVVSNVVNNAVKFRSSAGAPRIRLQVAREGGGALVSVSDNGIGLSEEELANAFKRFFKASPASEGSGVGLSMARLIAVGLGAEISIDSPGKGHGATVQLRFSEATTEG